MKKGYIIFLVVLTLIIVLLIIYPYMPSGVQFGILVTVIIIPVAFIAFFIIFPLVSGLPTAFGSSGTQPRESVDYERPIVQDRKAFLRTQPFFCENCKNFTDTLREFCEICGTKDSLRKAIKNDFNQYIKKKE